MVLPILPKSKSRTVKPTTNKIKLTTKPEQLQHIERNPSFQQTGLFALFGNLK